MREISRLLLGVVGAVVVGAAVCGRIPGLAKSQREQCRKAPHAMPAVGEGAELGLRECRHQFRHHRWNCSHVANDQVFGHVVVVGKDCPVTAASPLFIMLLGRLTVALLAGPLPRRMGRSRSVKGRPACTR
ncbi:protein Wnt-2b-A-like [Hylaeus anthracinus]|uniref:protein Wnt-2b-A-like n=1 Tax=Hylaeus anthracinus TaxID=313031 RepID=UPI0023B86F90|nr:protein Wnt-2b-A-like isoform X2 [Hylaeus volcanicus]XP_054011521.1 protein Wnt-2b-A-like [Hylaeus anthracinus]